MNTNINAMNRQVYRMPKAGNINHLSRKDEPLPDPPASEVQIEVKAVGLNFADIFAMQGLYSATPKGPFIPGLEFSGIITKAGAEAGSWKEGDRIMGATKFGGYVSHLNQHHRYVTALPDDWSYEQGAGFLVQGLTAYYGLHELGNLQDGYTVLIQSAAGGVGILANRICKKQQDVFTIGTVGSEQKAKFLLEEEGYDEVIVRDKDFYENLRQKLGDRELNLVMECIGGRIFKASYKAMAPMGRLITFGSASFTSHQGKPNLLKLIPKYLNRPKLDIMKMPTQNKAVMGFNLIWLYDRVDHLRHVLDKLQALRIEPQHIGHTFEWEELPQAIKLFRSGQTMGKVVIRTPDSAQEFE